ncbi:MAG: putative lipid II flippase FtsW [Endomicrobia bacterium]|nr:putative lipid II flippase FtsW [Endomicrobiia bacterium]
MFNIDLKKYDFTLISVASIAVIFGAMMVFSSSVIMADIRWSSPYMFFLKQMIWMAIGFAAMTVTAFFIDYKLYQKYAKVIYIIALIAVIAVLILGVRRGGAKRWFHVAFFTFQPSEIAKLAMVVIIADFISRKKALIGEWEGLVAPLVFLFLIVLPIAVEPDLGTPILIAGTCFAMLFCAGLRMQAILAMAGGGLILIAEEIIRKPYRLARFRNYLDSFVNVDAIFVNQDKAFYQIKQSLYALGSGGFFGKGLGKSEMKLMYLPEAHTDFIFPIIGEELGFIGAGLVLAFFIYIFFKGMKISRNAPDIFGEYLAMGITLLIVFQAVINLSVATGVFPAKGLPLPFISFGGTSLVINMAAMGILINMSQYAEKGRVKSGK